MPRYNLRIEIICQDKIVNNDEVLQQVKSFVIAKHNSPWKKIIFKTDRQSVFMGDLMCEYTSSDKDLNTLTQGILNEFAENEIYMFENLGLQFYIFRYLDFDEKSI
jgi:hypothetical protein